MSWIKITSIKNVKKVSKAGQEYEAVEVTGMKKGYNGAPDEEWSKLLFPWRDEEIIEAFRAIGVGNTADVKQQRVGKFWEIQSVTPVKSRGKAGGAAKAGRPGGRGGDPAPRENIPVVKADPVSNDDRWLACLQLAVKIMNQWMAASENFKGLIKRSVTPELYKQMLIEIANEMYTSTPDDAQPQAADAQPQQESQDGPGEPGSDGEDSGDMADDDDVPF